MIVLASAIHDPEQGLKWLSDQHMEELKDLFDQIVIVSSPHTPDAYLDRLADVGCLVEKRTDNIIGKTYFRTIEKAFELDPAYIFYCDFDRILHWMHHHPEELAEKIQFVQEYDFVVMERTDAGYKEHHEALYETEQLPNAVIAKAMGEESFHDYLAGCFVQSYTAAEYVAKTGGTSDMSFFGSWPVMLKQAGLAYTYTECKGLSWETPNQHREAVNAAGGVSAWREQLSSREEWQKRTRMAQEFVAGLVEFEK